MLLTKRRRTLSNSESNEPRISCSNIPSSPKENKVKRGPGRPPKADRLISEESVGDEDVFTNGDASDGKQDMEDKKSDKSENTSSKKPNNEKSGTLFGDMLLLYLNSYVYSIDTLLSIYIYILAASRSNKDA